MEVVVFLAPNLNITYFYLKQKKSFHFPSPYKTKYFSVKGGGEELWWIHLTADNIIKTAICQLGVAMIGTYQINYSFLNFLFSNNNSNYLYTLYYINN